VRCVYCGTHFPKKLDFDIPLQVPKGSPRSGEVSPDPAATQSTNNRKRGIIGTLAVLALKAKSLLVLLKFGKIALTFGSMFVYIAVYSRIFGWPFATGLAICIFIHEMGHVTVNWMKGLKATAPMFIPFVGALIFIKQFPNDPRIQSESGAGGPAAGLLAALGCYIIGLVTGNPFWFALASLGAFINLFNMVPFPPLDGSHIVTVFSPRIYTAVLISLLLITIKLGYTGPMGHYSVMVVFIIIVGFVFRLSKAGDTRHLLASPEVRLRMAFVFVGLCVSLTLVGAASDIALSHSRLREQAHTSDIKTLDDYAVSADDQVVDSNEPEHRLIAASAAAVSVVILGLALLFWCVCACLIKRAAGWSTQLVSIPIGVFLYFLCLNIILIGADVYTGIYRDMTYAMVAATCAAIFCCGYVSFHKVSAAGAGPTLLMNHALAWAGAAALIVSYATDSLPVLAAVAAAAALYATANSWVVSLLIAQVYSSIGRSGKAISLFNRSFSANPPADARFAIYSQLVELELRLSHGIEALNTVDALASLDANSNMTIRVLWLRSAALMLLDRYDECLICIEQLLEITDNDPEVFNRLWMAHVRLAEMSLLRGWPDECVSQVERVLLRLTSANRSLQARMYLLRAQARVSSGDAEGAMRDCKLGLDLCKEPVVRERAAIVKSAILCAQGRVAEAVTILETALCENDGDMEIQYAYAMTLKASGDKVAALSKLKGLAAAHPKEHWGLLAAQALQV